MNTPQHALVVAGGRGSRLGTLTARCPKPMLPVRGVPMLEIILRGIADQAGIRQFVIVTGYRGDVIQAHFGDGGGFGWTMAYVDQASPRGVGHAVDCAHSHLAGKPFLMTYGDILLDPANYRRFVAESAGDPRTLVGLNWVEDPTRGAAVYLTADGSVERIVEKPPVATSTTHWNNAGLFVFDPLIFRYTEQLRPSARGELELSDAITAMIADGHRALGLELTGHWRDVGTPEDYAAVNAGPPRDRTSSDRL